MDFFPRVAVDGGGDGGGCGCGAPGGPLGDPLVYAWDGFMHQRTWQGGLDGEVRFTQWAWGNFWN